MLELTLLLIILRQNPVFSLLFSCCLLLLVGVPALVVQLTVSLFLCDRSASPFRLRNRSTDDKLRPDTDDNQGLG